MPSAAYVRQASLARRRRFRRAGWPGISTEPLPVTFPTSPLTMRVHIALGADLTASHLTWNWLDVTEWVRHDLGISLTVGRRDEAGRVNPSRAQLKLRNRDGRFVRRNPTGPYYGLLSRNTPIWIELNPGSGFVDRYHGFINEWPTRWADQSGSDSFVTITCAGIMRRMAQGEVLRSAMNRSMAGITPGDFVPVAYWPFEDGSNATQVASGLPGGSPGLIAGDGATFAAESDLPGSDPLPSIDEGTSVYLPIPAYTDTGMATMQLVLKVDASPASDTVFAEFYTPAGPITTWQLYIAAGSPDSVSMRGLDATGAVAVGTGTPLSGGGNPSEADFYGKWWFYSVGSFLESGALWGGLQLSDVNDDFAPSGAASSAHTTHAPATGMRIYGRAGVAVGHVGFFPDISILDETLMATSGAMSGHAGEQAHERIRRLCHETSMPVVALAASSALMGPQSRGTLLEVLRECEAADGGVLYEHQFGIGYQALSERYNQPVTLALDFDAGHIVMPAPADDDQRLRNEWTVSRANGSSATYRDDASVALNGLYDDQATVNVETDAQLADVAGWKVHVGTVDEYRWPGIPIKLHGSPDVIPAWLATPLGARMTIDNPPAGLPPDQIDLIIEGYTERWDSVSWDVSLSTSPASAYRVGVYGTAPIVSRYDSANSTLSAAVSSSDTSLTVVTEANHAPWVTTAAFLSYFPPNGPGFDIGIGGEQVTVTEITSATSPQTFTVTRGVNGVTKSHEAGAQVRLWQPARYAL